MLCCPQMVLSILLGSFLGYETGFPQIDPDIVDITLCRATPAATDYYNSTAPSILLWQILNDYSCVICLLLSSFVLHSSQPDGNITIFFFFLLPSVFIAQTYSWTSFSSWWLIMSVSCRSLILYVQRAFSPARVRFYWGELRSWVPYAQFRFCQSCPSLSPSWLAQFLVIAFNLRGSRGREGSNCERIWLPFLLQIYWILLWLAN